MGERGGGGGRVGGEGEAAARLLVGGGRLGGGGWRCGAGPAATPLCRTAATPLTAPCCVQATGALVHENADGTTAPVHGAAEAYLAEFRDKVGKGELTYEHGWVEVTK